MPHPLPLPLWAKGHEEVGTSSLASDQPLHQIWCIFLEVIPHKNGWMGGGTLKRLAIYIAFYICDTGRKMDCFTAQGMCNLIRNSEVGQLHIIASQVISVAHFTTFGLWCVCLRQYPLPL